MGVVSDKALAANAYTGMGGIVTALEHGADIVVCGRWCDGTRGKSQTMANSQAA